MAERKKPAQDPLKSFAKTADRNSALESSGGRALIVAERISPPMDIPSTGLQENSPESSSLVVVGNRSSVTSYQRIDKQAESSSLPDLSSSNDSEIQPAKTESPAAENRTTPPTSSLAQPEGTVACSY